MSFGKPINRLLASSVLLFVASVAWTDANADLARYKTQIDQMVGDLKQILDAETKSQHVDFAFRTTLKAIADGKLKYVVNLDMHGVLKGMAFQFNPDGTAGALTFGPAFLDSYKTGSTIQLSVLIHEMQHATDFITQHDAFVKAKNDVVEDYLYELDGMHVEAEFIQDYLVGKYRLSSFESFFLESFRRDNLDSASLFVRSESENVFLEFDGFKTAFNQDKTQVADLVSKIVKDGERRLQEYGAIPVDDTFLGYVKFIELKSFGRYMLDTMRLFEGNPTEKWSEVFGKYPDFEAVYNKIGVILKRDIDTRSQYVDSIITKWEQEYR